MYAPIMKTERFPPNSLKGGRSGGGGIKGNGHHFYFTKWEIQKFWITFECWHENTHHHKISVRIQCVKYTFFNCHICFLHFPLSYYIRDMNGHNWEIYSEPDPCDWSLEAFNIARKYFSVSMQKGTFKSYFVYISSTLKKIF